MHKETQKITLQRMRSRSSASDWGRSGSKSQLRRREKNVVEVEEERTIDQRRSAEKMRSRLSARERRKSRSKSQLRQREMGIVGAEKEKTIHQRSAGKMRSRTSVRDRERKMILESNHLHDI